MVTHTDREIGRSDRHPRAHRRADEHDLRGDERQRRIPGGKPGRHAAPGPILRTGADDAGAVDRPRRRDRRDAVVQQLSARLGDGGQHAVQVLQAEHPRRRRARPARRSTGPTGCPKMRPARSGTSSTTSATSRRRCSTCSGTTLPDAVNGVDADAAARHADDLHVHRTRRADAQAGAVLRDARPPRHRRRRLEGGHRARPADADSTTTGGSCTTSTRTSPRLHDLAETQPDILSSLVERWWQEADANNVLPVDERAGGGTRPRRPVRTEWTLWPGSRAGAVGCCAACCATRATPITAHITVPDDGLRGCAVRRR